jgi:DTW domain-containing protein YfiP
MIKKKLERLNDTREKCYDCYRPKISCMCQYIQKVETNTKFIIIMHPKEFKKTKNNTGRFTHQSLANSKIYIGIDFNHNDEINSIINNENNSCYVLYPDQNSIKLNHQTIQKENKKNVIFIIDSTWPCSNKILAVSQNISVLPKVSFEHNKVSAYKIKTQPNKYCLSTIESTLCVLELLNTHKIENISQNTLDNFLLPFEKMVEYQINCVLDFDSKNPRFFKRE